MSGSTVALVNESATQFFVLYETGFTVLPDQKHVIGVDASNGKNLVMEDLQSKSPTQIATHADFIRTVVYNQVTDSLLAGDRKGHVVQYQKTGDSFGLLRDFGDVGVGQVYCSSQVGDLVVFGGYKTFSLVVVSASESRLCEGTLKSPFLYTYSLRVCQGVNSQMYLSMGGTNPEYADKTPDCLEIISLYKE